MKNVPSNLKNLKSKVYILDIDKLLSGKLNDVVKKDIMYIMLRSKILKILPDGTYLVPNTTFNAKINEAESKILNFTNLDATTLLLLLMLKIK